MMGLFEFVSGVLNSFIELISVGWITRNQYNRFPIFNLKKNSTTCRTNHYTKGKLENLYGYLN